MHLIKDARNKEAVAVKIADYVNDHHGNFYDNESRYYFIRNINRILADKEVIPDEKYRS